MTEDCRTECLRVVQETAPLGRSPDPMSSSARRFRLPTGDPTQREMDCQRTRGCHPLLLWWCQMISELYRTSGGVIGGAPSALRLPSAAIKGPLLYHRAVTEETQHFAGRKHRWLVGLLWSPPAGAAVDPGRLFHFLVLLPGGRAEQTSRNGPNLITRRR